MKKKLKILFSDSKTQHPATLKQRENTLFKDKSSQLFERISELDQSSLKHLLKLNDKQAAEVYQRYQSSLTACPLDIFSGLSFRQLESNKYQGDEWIYLKRHLCILSAQYGVIRPQDFIRNYRLDFTVTPLSLKSFWKDDLNAYFKNYQLLDLASQEFSSLIDPAIAMHKVDIIDLIHGEEKRISANAKKVRGALLNLCVLHRLEELEGLKSFSPYGYHYNEQRSGASCTVFVREVES